jgi:transposase-like protein
METNVLDERLKFVADYESGQWSMTELCERYGVTRPTGYKWLARHRADGRAGLADRSRAPHQCPHRTSDTTAALIVEAREEYGWGAKKLLRILRTRYTARSWPARSTVNDVLERHHLLRKNRRHGTWTHPGATPVHTDHPNQVCPADFKGQFKTGDGRYCYPLTVTDHFSRALLVCRGLPSVKTALTQPVFRALFRAVGLPDGVDSRSALRRSPPPPQARADRDGSCSRLPRVRVALTKDGRSLLEHHRDRHQGDRQTFWHGLKREREREHDLQVYRAYECEAERLGDRGGRVERAILDHELKREYQTWLHERDRDRSDYGLRMMRTTFAFRSGDRRRVPSLGPSEVRIAIRCQSRTLKRCQGPEDGRSAIGRMRNCNRSSTVCSRVASRRDHRQEAARAQTEISRSG